MIIRSFITIKLRRTQNNERDFLESLGREKSSFPTRFGILMQ